MALGALALALAGCGGGDPGPRVTRLTAGGVDVAMRLQPWDGSRGRVVATLTPERGFHLYGADLPVGGLGGVGQRTRVTVGGALARTGRQRVDARVRLLRVTGVARPLPVYPEGPIRVTVPVRRARDGRATVSLSYGACSRDSCQVPVVGRRVAVDVP
ncbi:hypothetical protein AB0L40_13205 [Patulibacter sp. NPDC049589]|uniref:hypothetical protein n=1 Tax=Patulibacter sp. NPDC049589 TaxID=3154731 RepID=UPI003429ED29